MGTYPVQLSTPPEPTPIVHSVDDKLTASDAVSVSSDACSCVKTASKYATSDVPIQDADKFIPNSTPIVGGLVLMEYDHTDYVVHHVAVIEQITPDGFLIVEGNYKPCEETRRFIPFDYSRLRGFWFNG